MSMMTEKQAYAAMFHFLEENWKRNNSFEVRDLLSAMSLLPDGSPADPAIINDWRQAIEYALRDGKAGSLTLK